MRRRLLAAFLALGLGAAPPVVRSQGNEVDSDLAKGIKQVDDGDYDGAILTLDTVARQLATQPPRARDLSQAYLYLGIAYVGKGQEAAARARFREALAQAKDLSLSPDNFPPKVINLFEAAKEEMAKEATPSPSPPPTTAPPEKKGGGGGKTALLILGGAAVVGGGVALAAGGGGGSSSTPATTAPADLRKTDTHSGQLCGYNFPGRANGTCQYVAGYDVVVSNPGTLDATVTWSDTSIFFDLALFDEAGKDVAESSRTTSTTSQLTAAVTPQTACSTCAYHIQVDRGDSSGLRTFTLVVKHP